MVYDFSMNYDIVGPERGRSTSKITQSDVVVVVFGCCRGSMTVNA